jgi:hypothetical protein
MNLRKYQKKNPKCFGVLQMPILGKLLEWFMELVILLGSNLVFHKVTSCFISYLAISLIYKCYAYI